MNDRIEIDYLKCFSKLATHYRRHMLQIPWNSIDWKTVDINEYTIWLSSIINDSDRLLNEQHLCRPILPNTVDNNAPTIDLKRQEVVAKYGALQMMALDIISSLMFTRLLNSEDSLLLDGFPNALKTELLTYKNFFAEEYLYGLFCTIIANKSLILFLYWITQELLKLNQNFLHNKKTNEEIKTCIDKVCTNFRDSKGVLSYIYKQFTQCGSNILYNIESDEFPSNGLWITLPSYMCLYEDELLKLFKKIRNSKHPTMFSKVKNAIHTHEKSNIISLLTTHAYITPSKRVSSLSLSQPRRRKSGWGTHIVTTTKQTDETILTIHSVIAANLRVYDKDIDYQDVRSVYLEFISDDFLQKLDLNLSSDCLTWESKSCNIEIPLNDTCIARSAITVRIRYSNCLMTHGAIFGTIQIPLLFIDPLHSKADYPVEIYDKAMEENMLCSFGGSKSPAFPCVSLVMSVE